MRILRVLVHLSRFLFAFSLFIIQLPPITLVVQLDIVALRLSKKDRGTHIVIIHIRTHSAMPPGSSLPGAKTGLML